MTTLRRLPALKSALLLATGILIAFWTETAATTFLLISSVSLCAAIVLDRRLTGQLFLALALVASGGLTLRSTIPIDDFQPARLLLTGTISEPPIIRRNQTYFPISRNEFQDNSGRRARLHGRIWVRREAREAALKSGMRVEIEGILSPTGPPRNPGDFNTKAWRERNGFIGVLSSSGRDELKVTSPTGSFIHRIRNGIIRISDRYGGQNAPLLRALLLGIRRDIDPELVDNLRSAGLSHLLALSGLHIGFLVLILFGVASMVRLPPAGRSLLVIVGIVLFLILVPMRSCTLRAAIMASAFFIGPVVKRWSPPLNSLSLAALLVLCIRPGDLFDAGFQLSFAAAGGIILYLPSRDRARLFLGAAKRRSRRLLWRYIVEPFLVSSAATLFVLPLTSCHFGMMAFGAPVYNIIAIPLLGFIFAASWLMVGLSLVWSGLASLAADGVNGAVFLFKWLVHWFSICAPVWRGHLAPVTILVLLSSPAWLVISRRKYPAKLTIALLLLLTGIVIDAAIPFPSRFQVWFLDVGSADAQVWLFPDGRTAVIDGGRGRRGRGGNAVAGLLDRYDIGRVDLMNASHPEADHIGGLIDVIEKFPVKTALSGPKRSTTLTYARLCSVSTAKGLNWRVVSAGDRVLGLARGYDLSIEGPPAGAESWSANDASVVMKLKVPAGGGESLRLLTTGDVERRGEAALVKRGGIEAQILKIPHHGSKTSSSPDFIAAVKPRTAVVTRSSKRYSMERPSFRALLKRLKTAGIEVHQTGVEGALLFEPAVRSGRAEWRLTDWRHPPFWRWFFGLI